MMRTRIRFAPTLVLPCFVLMGCDAITGAGSDITDEQTAKAAMRGVSSAIEAVMDGLAGGTYSSTAVTGAAGVATVDGTETYDHGGTGDFVWSEYDVDVTIRFDAFQVTGGGAWGDATVSGTVEFAVSDRTTQSGTGAYSSTRQRSFSGSDVEIVIEQYEYYDLETLELSYIDFSDRVTFTADNIGDSSSQYRISVTTSGGETYTFSAYY